MGLSFDQVLSKLRDIGDGAVVQVALVTNQDDRVVSYAGGALNYHSHRFLEGGLPNFVESLASDDLQYLFNFNTLAVEIEPGPADGFGGKSLVQPFSVKAAEDLKMSFLSIGGINTNPVTIKLTLLSEGNDAFSVELTPLGDILHGVGQPLGPPQWDDDFRASAVYLVSFGKPFRPDPPPA